MKLTNKRVEVKIGRTINLGNFESKRIDIGVEGDITNSVTIEQAVKELHSELETLLGELTNEN